MSSVQDFKIRYLPRDTESTFLAGDTVEGSVTFTLTSEAKIKRLYVMAAGGTEAVWGTGHGTSSQGLNAQKGQYNVKEILIEKKDGGTVLPIGDHCFKFKITIPESRQPDSSDGFAGYMTHVLYAKLSRSWHLPCFTHKIINLQSGAYVPDVKVAQMFTKVHLSATVDRRVCAPGETLNITAKIVNKTSKTIQIKCIPLKVSMKFVMREDGKKQVGPTVEPGFDGDVSFPFTVPGNAELGLEKKDTLEFFLKVYLDVSFDRDPAVVLGPLFITLEGNVDPDSSSKAEEAAAAPSSSDFPAHFSHPYPAYGPHAYAYPPPGLDQYSTNAQFMHQTPPAYASVYPSTDMNQQPNVYQDPEIHERKA